MLRFTENLCVQCGLCEATCPEKVITLEPRLDFAAWNAPPRVLKEEEPFHCIACANRSAPGVPSTACWQSSATSTGMFRGDNARRLDVIKMCADLPRRSRGERGFLTHIARRSAPGHDDEDYLRRAMRKKDDPLGS